MLTAEKSVSVLHAMLKNVNSAILITVPETGEILFFNDDEAAEGRLCYKFMYGKAERCEWCPYARLMDKPDEPVEWEITHPANNRTYRLNAVMIDWPGIGKAHLEFGIEISDKVRQLKMAESILNGVDALITVADIETNKILFLNDSIRKNFGIEHDGVGHLCHKLLQKLDEPCKLCPINELKNNPDETIVWEHRETVKDRLLLKTAKLIDWVDGRKAHLEYAIDITEKRELEQNVTKLKSEVQKNYLDSLTGIHNRRYFEDNIGNVISYLARSSGMLSMMMVDIDYFKNYNDTYGHIRGDECLKIIAETLRGCMMRKEDFVARYGGEEFVVVLPNTDGNGACLLAEKMLKAVRNRRIPHSNSETAANVTVSIGATSGSTQYKYRREDYLKLADELLYKAKQGGRNRYSFAML